MLETIGTVMIAAAIVVLLILMALAYQRGGAERRPAVAETVIAGLAAVLAIGQGLAELGTSRSEGESHAMLEVGRFGMVGGALVLMWLWSGLGHSGRAPGSRHSHPGGMASSARPAPAEEIN
jgi:hypothetical protein